MRLIRLILLTLIVLGSVGLGAGWYLAGREAGPSITIKSPDKFVGRNGTLDAPVFQPRAGPDSDGRYREV